MKERDQIQKLLERLEAAPMQTFPVRRGALAAPPAQGVYVIVDARGRVVHVGRTVRGKSGLHQRLKNHLYGQSSFVNDYLEGRGDELRQKYSYKWVEVRNDRMRALVEAAAIAWYCPRHLGVGQIRS